MMIVLIVYVFTASVYTSATSMPETLHNAAHRHRRRRQFGAVPADCLGVLPAAVHATGHDRLWKRVDPGMDAGQYTFALVIPPNFQRDVLAGAIARRCSSTWTPPA
jgi:ABC-2 type transport system permease protein